MTLKKSMDDGTSWQVETLVYAGPAAYSLVVPLTNDSLGVVYERNGPGESSSHCRSSSRLKARVEFPHLQMKPLSSENGSFSWQGPRI
jgi:hypothetical protein